MGVSDVKIATVTCFRIMQTFFSSCFVADLLLDVVRETECTRWFSDICFDLRSGGGNWA